MSRDANPKTVLILVAAIFAAGVLPCRAQSNTGASADTLSQTTVESQRSCAAELAAANRALKAGQYDEAARRYSAIEARACPGAEMEIAINRGMAYHHLGRYAEAMRDYDVAVKFDPRDRHVSAVLHNNRCYSLTQLGRAAEALADCDKAVSLSPRQNETYLSTRAVAYAKLERYQEALRDFDAALKSAPKRADLLYSRGIIRLHLGMPEGEVDVKKALALDPSLGRAAAPAGSTPSAPER